MTALHDQRAVDLCAGLRAGEFTAMEVTDHYLDRVARLDPSLGAFATVTADAARERAAQLDAVGPGDGANRVTVEPPTELPVSTPLWGLPIADKDLTDRAGVPTGFGSRTFAGPHRYIPTESADITRVLDAAGGISLGKTAAPEFGFPSYTETLVGPPARNPWDPSRGAGGSSGGAAVAVAAGMLPVAPGSDGGGSIRIPAAACGLVGLKPTRGLLPAGGGQDSLGGLVVHGPLARTVADAALLLEGMLPRTHDGTVAHPMTLRTSAAPVGAYLEAAQRGETADGRTSWRVGVSTYSAWELAYDITLSVPGREAWELTAAELTGLGHEVVAAGPWEPDPGYAPAFRTLWMAGASAVPLDDPERLALLEPLTRWLIERGRAVTARELAEALAALSRFERRLVAQVAEFDAVLLPGMAMTPRPLGWHDALDPERNFTQQCQYTPYTSMINVAGLPAIALPVHQTAPEPGAPAGLPMGVQLVGNPGGEQVLLAIAAQLEDRLHWADRRPPVW